VATVNASYYGGGTSPVEPYAFWSNAAPSLVLGIDVRSKDIDYPALRKLIEQWRSINHMYYGDYYPLTPYSREKNEWIAWQFNLEESGEGMIQAFRRDECADNSITLKLRGLDSNVMYSVYDIAKTWKHVISGDELTNKGLPVTISDKPGAAVIVYQKVSKKK
jgi:alpha-galactosidase